MNNLLKGSRGWSFFLNRCMLYQWPKRDLNKVYWENDVYSLFFTSSISTSQYRISLFKVTSFIPYLILRSSEQAEGWWRTSFFNNAPLSIQHLYSFLHGNANNMNWSTDLTSFQQRECVLMVLAHIVRHPPNVRYTEFSLYFCLVPTFPYDDDAWQ